MTVISAIKSKVPNAVKEYLESSLDDALYKVIQKHSAGIIKEHSVPAEIMTTLFNIITKSNSFYKSPKHRALYHALMESILEDEDAMDKGVADELKKRKPDDADKDECPFAGSNRGLKRQRTSKENETSKNTSATKDSFRGKSPATSSKSSKSGKSAKDQVVEPIFVQDSDNVEHDVADYANMLMDQGEDLVNTYEQPNDEIVPKNDWYKKSSSDTSPDPDIVKVNKWYGYGHLEEIIVKKADQQLYTFKEGDFKRPHLNDIEDMIFLARVDDLTLAGPAYTTLSNPQGVIYEDNLKRKRFMRADEFHKFSKE
ncbi:hypothetical protein Tco_1046046 [Tanacetum coccineum]